MLVCIFADTLPVGGVPHLLCETVQALAIALMRDDVTIFSGNMKARLGGERFAWFVYDQGEIFSNCGLFVAFFAMPHWFIASGCRNSSDMEKSPGIAYHWKTKSHYPNGLGKYGEQTRQ